MPSLPVVENYVTGKSNARFNRIRAMSIPPMSPHVNPSLANRFWDSKVGQFIVEKTSNKPPPMGTMKRTRGGGIRNYNLRALQFLSERSQSMARKNLTTLKSKRNKRMLRKALHNTRRLK